MDTWKVNEFNFLMKKLKNLQAGGVKSCLIKEAKLLQGKSL